MAKVFRVFLTGEQEVPPTGSTKSGFGAVIFDDAALTARYAIRYTGLDFGGQTPGTADDVVSHHVHSAVSGTNGSGCRRESGWNSDDALSDDMKVSSQAARSIG